MAKIISAFLLSVVFALSSQIIGQTRETVPDPNLDSATKYALINEILATINDHYFSVEMAAKMVAGIRQKIARKEYESITSPKVLAVALTLHLQEICRDRHVYVRIADPEDMETGPRPTPREENYGFTKLEILPGNVGLIEINSFPPPGEAAETLAAVMKFVQNTDALIIDLRNNTGGAIPMVALMVSYFVPPKPIHLLTVDSPRILRQSESWTVENVAGPRYLDRPVFILTGPETFSGGEEFAYDMQALKRARIVGTRTKGGANPVRTFMIRNIFRLGVSFAQVKSPITGSNWEGTGVDPDMDSSVDNALNVALAAVKREIEEKNSTAADNRPEVRSSNLIELSTFPDTPAGKTFALFLAALNSGNRDKLVDFHLTRLPDTDEGKRAAEENAKQDLDFFLNSGGIVIRKIHTSTETKIQVIAQFKQRNETVLFTMEVEPAAPHAIVGINVAPASLLK